MLGAALTLGLGIYRLGDESLWLDEGLSAMSVRQSWPALLGYIVRERPIHALYYPLLKVWSSLGSSEVALRSLSVVCMAAAAGVLALLADRLFGRTAALASAVLFAVNPFVVAYAQEARVYALVVLLAVSASLLLVRALDRPSPGRWAAWAVCAVSLVYGHAIAGGTVLIAQAAAILLHPRGPRRPALVAGGLVAAGLAPLAILAGRTGTSAIAWIEPPDLADVREVMAELAGRSQISLTILLALAAVGVAGALRRSPTPRPTWQVGFAALLFAGPVLVGLLVSQLVPVFVSRYTIAAVLGLVLLAGAGISALPRSLAVVAVMSFVAASVPGLATWYARVQKEDWRGAAALVASAEQPGDAVVVPRGGYAFRYYHGDRALISLPDALAGGLRGADRVWVVVRQVRDPEAARELARLNGQLTQRRRQTGPWRFKRLVVYRFGRVEHRPSAER